MIITHYSGAWMEKSIKTSPEDSFIHSEVTYLDHGKEKTLHLVYIGYFEKEIIEMSPFEQDPIFNFGDEEIHLRDVTALIALIQFPEYRKQKRIYYHDQEQFNQIFKHINFEKLEEALGKSFNRGQLKLEDLDDFLNAQAG